MALLLALTVLLLVMVTIGTAITAVASVADEVAVATIEHRLADALRSGEGLALAWVRSGDQRIVLPPEGGGVSLCHDRWSSGETTGSLQVDLYDALAGVPAHLAVAGQPLRLALPPAVRALVIPGQLSPPVPGQPNDLIERLDLPGGVRRFPVPMARRVCRWGVGEPAPVPEQALSVVGLAQFVAVHAEGSININTAPADLLGLAFQMVGRGGLDVILERRRAGTFSDASDASESANDGGDGGIRLVDRSSTWNALVTVSSNGVSRSRWVVIAGNPGLPRIVQRHVADR